MKSPILPPHPLDHPGSIKIMLGREASEAIAANWDFHFAGITHPDATSPPEAHGRLILVLIRTDREKLNAATRVALGMARAVPITPAKPKARRHQDTDAPAAVIDQPAPTQEAPRATPRSESTTGQHTTAETTLDALTAILARLAGNCCQPSTAGQSAGAMRHPATAPHQATHRRPPSIR